MKINNEEWTNKGAAKIARALLQLQTAFSKFMNKHFNKVTRTGMKFLVILFCFASGGYSMYLIAKAAVSRPGSSIRVDSFKIPAHIIAKDSIYKPEK